MPSWMIFRRTNIEFLDALCSFEEDPMQNVSVQAAAKQV